MLHIPSLYPQNPGCFSIELIKEPLIMMCYFTNCRRVAMLFFAHHEAACFSSVSAAVYNTLHGWPVLKCQDLTAVCGPCSTCNLCLASASFNQPPATLVSLVHPN